MSLTFLHLRKRPASKNHSRFALLGVLIFYFFLVPSTVLAQEAAQAVELNGDEVEFSVEDNKFYARGNVVITRGDTVLTADEIDFNRDEKIAHARGNVILDSAQGTIYGESLTFNFDSMSGEFMGAKIYSHPYYGYGAKIAKVEDGHIVMEDGYITTSDFDKPEWRMKSKRIDVYPGEKMVARHMRLLVGDMPLMYIPKFVQDISDKKPRVIFTPGYDKDWGAFLLQAWRYKFSDDLKGFIHLDYRTRLDFASGFDTAYNTREYGEGVIKTYFTRERKLQSGVYPWEEKLVPTPERDRFKVEWRHKWEIDPTTDAILQYYRLSDKEFLHDYFEREFDKDPSPDTFFLFTKALPKGTFSFRTDARVNRFESKLERLPEIRYDLINQEIMDSNFIVKSTTTYSNLVLKSASPSEIRPHTMRVDTDNEISYPMKISFIEFKPFVGGRHTYYSRTKENVDNNKIRGIFRTGGSLSTKFYRIFDVNTSIMGIDINRLRHIITPSIGYTYQGDPTVANTELDQFDGVDSLTRKHDMTFALENKLQTKRDGESVDLARTTISTNFKLKEDPGLGGFNNVSTDIELRPANWLRFYFDSTYDTNEKSLTDANFDLYINGRDDKWYFDVGKRFNREVDDQLTAEFGYTINPKWSFKIYERIDLDKGQLKEQNYSLVRDLHSWTMEVNLNSDRVDGEEFTVVFTLKAFPDIGFDFGKRFNRNRGGSSQ